MSPTNADIRSYDVHTLRVDVEGPCPDSALDYLLGQFPKDAVRGKRPGLLLRFRPVPGGTLRDPVADGATSIFGYGHVAGCLDPPDVLLSDGYTLLRIAADGTRIDIDLAPESMTDPYAFAALPFLFALIIAFRHHGLFHVHAGAVVADDEGILIAGGTGAGKSTLTVAFTVGGCDYVCDDAGLMTRRGGEIQVLALPRPFHVHERTLAAFPSAQLARMGLNPAGKELVDARASFPGRERAGMQPRVLLFPQVVEQDQTEVVPLSPADAFVRLGESSAFVVVDHMPGVGEQLSIMKQMVDQARSFVVTLGADLLTAPETTTRRILETVVRTRA